MITVPLNPTSVHIPMINIGCCKSKFDSTYPIHLNGIISKEDFHKSISKINHTISSNKILICLSIIFCLSIIGGIMLLYHLSYEFRTIGIIVIISGSILFGIGWYTIKLRRIRRMRHAIAEESKIYSSRSPIPCSWRLDTMTHFVGRYGIYRNNHLGYHLVIDIGRSTAPESVVYYSNQDGVNSTSVIGRHNNMTPPPYSAQSAIEFCSRCGASRQDLTSKFCSSCGQSFNTC
ncbi:unnamed protein product [Rotaria sp. Silwood2]|nr:unnamed protein product [Rotaria sp. Silwood2]CAF3093611.1 unnamed protein product [Rotaria sp. Silwood2]CAF3459278.1 unnamed protein product [Rotaria sp. Silwood2]CAF4271115.1 unnamed protein product [Rotaria sp. Silwood2]CAF4530795.1 unnamed protein product [Rotaria sp. Silwood2]